MADRTFICVSQIKDFANLFRPIRVGQAAAEAFNESLAGWDVSSATTMRAMFLGATSFDADLSSWVKSLKKLLVAG